MSTTSTSPHAVPAKDLTKQPPRSPTEKLGPYAIFARAIDKCRAELAGQAGEYHFNCPLDQMLFRFKGIDAEQLRAQVRQGADDQQLLAWLESAGTPRSAEEAARWGEETGRISPHHDPLGLFADPQRREDFLEDVRRVGLDPATANIFNRLDADDRASFPGA